VRSFGEAILLADLPKDLRSGIIYSHMHYRVIDLLEKYSTRRVIEWLQNNDGAKYWREKEMHLWNTMKNIKTESITTAHL
jgi:hypothetical protein